MQDITISRATIKEIAQRIYDDVDAYDYQDSGYSMKDVEMAVTGLLQHAVDDLIDLVPRIITDSDIDLDAMGWHLRRHCDAAGCEMLVRSDNDIWCHRHGEIEDKRQAEVEAAMATQFDDLAF